MWVRGNVTRSLRAPSGAVWHRWGSSNKKPSLVLVRQITTGPKSSKLKEFQRLVALAKPEKGRLAAAIGLLVISSGVTMSVPFALGRVIDIIYSMDQIKTISKSSTTSSESSTGDPQPPSAAKAAIESNLRNVCGILVGVFAVGATANFGRVYLMRIVSQRITARLRNSLFSSISRQEVAFFDKNKTGELVNRLSADTLVMSQAISQQVSDGLRSAFMTGAGIGMMFYMSPQLALVSLGVVPPVAAWGVVMGRKVRSTSRNVQDALAGATQVAEERISNIRTVRAFATENREIQAYDQQMDNVLAKAKVEALAQAKFYGITGLSGNMIILTVLYYGGSLVTSDVITVGNLTSFILYAAYVGIGFSGVSTFYAETMKALGASSRIWEITDKVPAIPVEGGLVPGKPLKGEIEFQSVAFSYPSRPDVKVLDGLSLKVPSDRVTAVVGGSGSGKSTLAALILRLYDPDSGRLTVDGRDVRDLDPSWLRRQIGTVSQEPVLFSTSIRDNIAYGAADPSAVTEEELERAAREANAHDFIAAFPEGYDTLVGERGVMLSGGQKQRVAIARAILMDPQILLLDEATSALDTASEYQVKVALDRVMKNRSVVTIAHRLSTIQNADHIAVIHQGSIVEEGTYQELMRLENGRFRALIRQ